MWVWVCGIQEGDYHFQQVREADELHKTLSKCWMLGSATFWLPGYGTTQITKTMNIQTQALADVAVHSQAVDY